MVQSLRRPFAILLGALATTSLGGCYYGDVYSAGYGSNYGGSACSTGYYDYDPYAYDDGYGYDCYDSSDYGGGFVNIGFGGGWYNDYYYPGSGMWLFDRYNQRYPLRGDYLNYWGGRRAWWRHHGNRGDGYRKPDAAGPNGWNTSRNNRNDRDNPRGTRPGGSNYVPAPLTNVPGTVQNGNTNRNWADRNRDNRGSNTAPGTQPRPQWNGGNRPVRPEGTTPSTRPQWNGGARPARPEGTTPSTRPQWNGGNRPARPEGSAPRPQWNGGGNSGASRPSTPPPAARPAPAPAPRPAAISRPSPSEPRSSHVREQ